MLSRHIASKLRGFETPFYLYDTALLRQTLESVVYESKKYGYKVHYAIKANYDDHLLAIIREYGLGIDCASGNELRKAIEAGFDPKGIVYAGVGKRDKELRYAIEQDILAINCESIEELELVDALAGEAGRVADVALRINPDIDPKTNHCIDTGQADSKFGISYEEVLEIRALKYINIIGLHLHIGSQIRELHVFENMCNKVNVIVENLEKLGCSFRFVDVGGGLGVNYDVPENEPIPNFASLFSIVHNHLSVGDREVHFEFGRSIVAECGELITKVLFNKTTATGRKLVIVDASQSAGTAHIDMHAMGLDVVCFTGHKGFMGPQGTGGLAVAEGIDVAPWAMGGTGVHSFDALQPLEWPTRLEAGTLNGHGIAGLSAGLGFIEAQGGVEAIAAHERSLAERFLAGVREIPGIALYGAFDQPVRSAIVSLNVGDIDSAQISDALMQGWGIATRPGAHCAPLMHRALGTERQGVVRFSFGYFNTDEEVDTAIDALRDLAC